jgi:hypothetical protein
MTAYDIGAVATVAHRGLAARSRAPVFALLTYTGIAFLYFGLRVVLRGDGAYVGHGVDPQIFIWSFGWWPHALLHGENPLVTHAIWAPSGLNLTWTTAVPGLAILFAPVTLLFGPLVAYNVAANLMPALAAWTCFLLCRRLTGSLWASFVGGYLFGFSSYMLGQQEGHMHMTSVFLIPLIAISFLQRLRGEIGSRRLALQFGALFLVQLLFSTELLLTVSLAIIIALLVAYAASPQLRARIRALVFPLVGAYLIVLVIASPFVYYAAKGFERHSINAPRSFTADFLNLVLPTRLMFVDWDRMWQIAEHFPGNDSERDAYIGLPTLILVALFARRRWRLPYVRVLLLWLSIALLAEFGAELHVNGHAVLPLPAALVDHLPLLNNILPVRIALFASLITAVIVALVVASARSPWTRVVLPVLAVVALLPRPGSHSWITVAYQPRFITDGIYRTCLARDETVVVLPFGGRGDSMLWQAQSDYWFRLAGGFMRPDVPPPFNRFRVVHPALAPTTTASNVYRFARATGARAVIVDQRHAGRWRSVLGGHPTSVGGVLIYPVPGSGYARQSCR